MADPFIIEPLNRLGQPAGGKFTFSGWALPHKKPSFKTGQRSIKREYQGNPEATIQKQGPTFPDSIFEGCFRFRYTQIKQSGQDITASDFDSSAVQPGDDIPTLLSVGGHLATSTQGSILDATALTTPEYLKDALEKLSLSGQDVRVTLSSFSRKGHLKWVEFKPDSRTDIHWSLTFEWFGRDDLVPPPLVVTKFKLDAGFNLATNVAAILGLATGPLAALSMPGGLLFQVSSFVGQLQESSNELQAAIGVVSNTTSDVITIAKRAINVLRIVQTTTASLMQLLNTADSDASSVANDAVNLVNFEDWRHGLLAQCLVTQRDARDSEDSFKQTVTPLVLTSFYASQDTDARDVSIKFFGTDRYWQVIVDFNDIPTSLIPANTLVFIPRTS